MVLYEKMPPYLAEIPYGFKNLWKIAVSEYDLQNKTFNASDIQSIVLNGGNVTVDQLTKLFDFNRDGCSLSSTESGEGLFITLTGYNAATNSYSFDSLVAQNLEISGVVSISGDMIDNSNPQQPIVNHDEQKLDVTQYNNDQAKINRQLDNAAAGIETNTTDIAALQADAITNITVNGSAPVPKEDGTAEITIAALTPEELQEALNKKVDKTVAGTGNKIVQGLTDSFDQSNRTLSLNQNLLSLETGETETANNSYALADLLGITDLEAIDKELIYLCPDTLITSFNNPVTIPLSNIYRFNDNGSIFTPDTTANVQIIFAIATNYSGINIEAEKYISAIGYKTSADDDNITCIFVNLRKYDIYNKYNSYRQGVLVYDANTNAIYRVLRPVPLPSSEGTIIPINNSVYYQPITDKSNIAARSVFANFEENVNPGKAYTVDETRIELMKGVADEFTGYNDYIDFKNNTIPASILTDDDWNANINLWVTDGMVFTELSALSSYLTNFTSPNRYKISNLGIVATHAEGGGITISPLFDLSFITAHLNSQFILTVPNATSNNIAVFDDSGQISDGGTAISGLATAAQGAKADSAVQSVMIGPGALNGTVKITVDNHDSEAAVTGLGTAAYQPANAFATSSQGAKADTAIQSVALSGGTNNGTIKLTVDGVSTDNINVTGLNSAAYQAANSFATAEQGAKADSAIQSISLESGTNNGTINLTVDGASSSVAVKGLGTAAYTASTIYATAAQGAKADSAIQPESIIDNLASTDATSPLSANQGRVLNQKIEAMSASGKPIGGFATYADRYTNTNQFAADLQPININDTIYIAADENHSNMPAQYKVAEISEDGAITYSFVKIVPDTARDFSLNPITTSEIEEGAVTSTILADNSVTTSKIPDNSITIAKLSFSLQASSNLANNSLQSPISTTGTGGVVTSISQNDDKTLSVTYGNALNNVVTSGSGDFVTEGNISGSTLTLVKNGTAIKDVVEGGSGNVVTNVVKDSGGSLSVIKGTAITGVSSSSTGNAVSGISINGANLVPTMTTLLSSITKSGTGNAITSVSTGTNGAVTLGSDTFVKTVATTGEGNVVTGLSLSGGALTATKGTAVTSLPSSSTSQAGIVQLNNTLASDSSAQALTAQQGKALKTLIDTNDNSVVHLANSETITGTKTFTAHPIVPSKTSLPASPSATQYATEAQVNTRYAKVANATANSILAVGNDANLIDTGIDYTAIVETTDPRLTNARPASDVSAWAKETTKPTYTAAEVGADPTGTAASAITVHNSDEDAHSALFATKEAAGTAASAVATHNTADDAHSSLFAEKAEVATYTATLTTTYAEDSNGYQAQTVNVSGLLVTDEPTIDCVLSGTDKDADTAILQAFSLINRATTGAGTLTVQCIGDAPTVAIPIILQVVR